MKENLRFPLDLDKKAKQGHEDHAKDDSSQEIPIAKTYINGRQKGQQVQKLEAREIPSMSLGKTR